MSLDPNSTNAAPCQSTLDGEYNLPLHVGSIFIIMALCTLGMLVPILTKRMPKTATTHLVFCAAKMFGTGVILATAIVHMFLPAVLLLASPCLPSFWLVGYPAFAAVFFLLGILGTHLLQVILTARMTRSSVKEPLIKEDIESPKSESPKSNQELASTAETETLESRDCTTPVECHADHIEHHMDLGVLDTDDHCHGDSSHSVTIPNEEEHSHTHGLSLLKERQLSVYLLEMGIFSHSVLIGITLGVARAEFVSLLIALCFHQ